jgi:hypothetical protein
MRTTGWLLIVIPRTFWSKVFFLAFAIMPCSAVAQVLIPVTDRRDHVFDNTRSVLYVSTASGDVERYDVASNTLLTPFTVAGTSFNGIDISRDNQFVFVADATQAATQGVFRKFNTDTGARTNLFYNRDFGEGEAWDIAVTNAGHAIVTTEYNGSGWIPMRRLDLSTDTYSSEIRSVRQRTHLHRSSDGGLIFFLESNSSAGPIGIYDPATRTFPTTSGIGSTNSNRLGAVNRNGTLIAIESGGGVSIVDRSLNSVELLGGLQGGIGFSPVLDVFFGVDVNSDQVVAYDTNTFAEIRRYAIGENVTDAGPFGNGIMSFSSDGRKLFLSTPMGIRMLNVEGIPEPSVATLLLVGALMFVSRQPQI